MYNINIMSHNIPPPRPPYPSGPPSRPSRPSGPPYPHYPSGPPYPPYPSGPPYPSHPSRPSGSPYPPNLLRFQISATDSSSIASSMESPSDLIVSVSKELRECDSPILAFLFTDLRTRSGVDCVVTSCSVTSIGASDLLATFSSELHAVCNTDFNSLVVALSLPSELRFFVDGKSKRMCT